MSAKSDYLEKIIIEDLQRTCGTSYFKPKALFLCLMVDYWLGQLIFGPLVIAVFRGSTRVSHISLGQDSPRLKVYYFNLWQGLSQWKALLEDKTVIELGEYQPWTFIYTDYTPNECLFPRPEQSTYLVGRTNEWVANPVGLRQTRALQIKTRSAISSNE